MSFTSRYSSSPASAQRDYGLLQAPSTSYRPFQGLDDDVSENAEAEEEESINDAATDSDALTNGSRRIVQPKRQSGQFAESRRRGRNSNASLSMSSATGDEEDTLEAGSVADEDGMSSFSVGPASRRASASGSGSKRRGSRHASRIALTKPSPAHQDAPPAPADSEPRSLADRARGMFLGGEAQRPPKERIQADDSVAGEYTRGALSPRSFSTASTPLSPRFGARVSPNAGAPPGGGLTAGLMQLPAPALSAAATGAPSGPGQPTLLASTPAPVPHPEDVAKVVEELAEDGAEPGDVEEAVGGPAAGPAGSPATERTPLIGAEGAADGLTSAAARAREIKVLIGYSLPVWGTHLLELSLNIVTVFSLGHLGTTELGAASLASMTANVTGFSIISGFVSALDSLLPAAYASASPWTVGLWTQRMTVIISSLLIPIAIVWWSSESILLALGQDPQVAHLASKYLFILSFALPAYAGFETSRRYLQAQGLFSAPTIAVSIASILNVPLNVLLVYGPPSVRMGFIGAPIASLISYYMMLILGLVQCYLAPREAWGGWSWRAFDTKALAICWHLGAASTTAMAAEWWAWEIAGLLTSWLGTTPLAAQSVLLVTSSITYQLPYAIAVAAAVRVGNLLGANKPMHARLSSLIALGIGGATGLANSAGLVFLRGSWGWLFSSDEEVVHLVADILPFVAAFQIFDSICGVGGGLLRGSGRQRIGAYINLVSYYVFGIPTSIALIKLQWRLQGIWLGLTVGLVLGSIGTTWVILRTKWREEARRVQERMEHDMGGGAASAVVVAEAEASVSTL